MMFRKVEKRVFIVNFEPLLECSKCFWVQLLQIVLKFRYQLIGNFGYSRFGLIPNGNKLFDFISERVFNQLFANAVGDFGEV